LPLKKIEFFSWSILIFIDFPNLPVITGKFSPFTEKLLPVNEINAHMVRTTNCAKYPRYLAQFVGQLKVGKERS
jgi:hypothetical protein